MNFKLEIITPEKIVYSDTVDMVSVPSSTGTLGILPRHANLFALLTHGEIKIKQGDKTNFLSIGSGYVQVTKSKTVILVSRAKHADELDEAELVAAKARAEELIKNPPPHTDMTAIHSALSQSITDLKLLRKIHKYS